MIGKSTLYGLQILRGVAAVLVVMVHARLLVESPDIQRAFVNGAAGVDIFFVISGVVMSLTARALTPRLFAWRRITRIVPLYWFFTLLKLALMSVVTITARKIPMSPVYVLSCLFFIPAIDDDGFVHPIINAGWTLNFEMYFYAICTLALAFSRKWFALITAVIVTIGSVIGTALIRSGAHLPAPAYILAPISLEFVAGLGLGVLWQSSKIRLGTWPAAGLLLAGSVALAVAPWMDQFYLMRPLIWGVPSLAIVAAVLSMEPHIDFARWRFPVLLGDASYSLYLAHTATLPILFAVIHRVSAGPVLTFVLLVLGSIVSGILVYMTIERSLTRAFKALLMRLQGLGVQDRLSAF